MHSQGPHVLFAAPEIAPLTAGRETGRAVHALARALTRLGARVTVAAPPSADESPEALGLARWLDPVPVPGDGGEVEATVYEGTLPSGGGRLLVVDAGGADLGLVARAAVRLARTRGPWPDVVHATDATAEAIGLVRGGAGGERPAPATTLSVLGKAPPEAALRAADRVVAPSRDRARELAAAGAAAVAIPPGIDEARWAPSRDPHLPAEFSAADPSGKATCKLELQRELGLPPRAREPLVAALSPLGAALSADTADALAQSGAQIALYVDPERDDARARQAARDLAARYPTRVAAREGPSAPLSHRMVAGADLALLQRDAPAPISDLHVLAYGTLPVAPRTGEYADRIVDVDPHSGTGNGFLYAAGAGAEIVSAVRRGIRCFQDRALFEGLIARALVSDLSWETAASRYLEIYLEALRTRATPAA